MTTSNQSEDIESLARRSPEELAEIAFERIRIDNAGVSIQVRDGDRIIASSSNALALHETGREVRYYFPREDVDLGALVRIDERTHCPFKGDASDYWALATDPSGSPVGWSYPKPIAASAAIAGYIAFYDSVQVEPVP